MISREIVLRVVEALDKCEVPYMLVGSFSANFYGIERSTKDADLVIELGSQSVSNIFDAIGRDFRCDPQAVLEMATLTTRYVLSHVESAFKIELFLLSDEEHDRQRFARRIRAPYLGAQVWLPTAEDVVITKLRWAIRAKRAKDEDDVLGVLAVQKDNLDLPYLFRWCEQHGTRPLLEKCMAKVGIEIPKP